MHSEDGWQDKCPHRVARRVGNCQVNTPVGHSRTPVDPAAGHTEHAERVVVSRVARQQQHVERQGSRGWRPLVTVVAKESVLAESAGWPFSEWCWCDAWYFTILCFQATIKSSLGVLLRDQHSLDAEKGRLTPTVLAFVLRFHCVVVKWWRADLSKPFVSRMILQLYIWVVIFHHNAGKQPNSFLLISPESLVPRARTAASNPRVSLPLQVSRHKRCTLRGAAFYLPLCQCPLVEICRSKDLRAYKPYS